MKESTELRITGPREHSRHHYMFAHMALRYMCQRDPLRFFQMMKKPGRRKFLAAIWESVLARCEEGETPSFDISDVAVTEHVIDGWPAFIVEMPEPAGMTEVYFVAIILKVSHENPARTDPEAVYFTLELGFDQDQSKCTVLCQWSSDDSHMNFGDGPPPTKEAFLDAVSTQLKKTR